MKCRYNEEFANEMLSIIRQRGFSVTVEVAQATETNRPGVFSLGQFGTSGEKGYVLRPACDTVNRGPRTSPAFRDLFRGPPTSTKAVRVAVCDASRELAA